MFVRHFAARRRSQTYKDFEARYKEFREEDVVVICDDHHEEIHVLYQNLTFDFIKRHGYKPIDRFTWKEAHALMAELVAACNEWLGTETPGRRDRQFTGPRAK